MRLPISSAHRPASHGVALVIVLAMLVLMSALVVGFMSSATTETVAAKTYSYGVEARQTAEIATNLVISQIREATSKEGDQFTWISQPGALRVIGSGPSSSTVYKLYSAEKMQEPETSYNPVNEVVTNTADPTDIKDGYVDMNEPVFTPVTGAVSDEARYEARYPIVNPYAGMKFSLGNYSDAGKPGEGVVEGFYCEPMEDPNHKDASNENIRVLPMPVKWLYQLRDGTITTTDLEGKKIKEATRQNPPVARFAFWTDDESSKLNLNTASEPTYWDTPLVSTLQESGNQVGGQVSTRLPGSMSLNLAVSQPTRGEYQRYPGHPATTSLAPALRWLFPDYTPEPSVPNGQYLLRENAYKEAIYRLAPRITGGEGTSEGGQKINEFTNNALMNGVPKPEEDRLLATVDEYFFRPDRSGVDENDRYNRDLGTRTGDPAIIDFTPDKLEKLRFFLTANSRSPELNSFGRPRVSIWPVHQLTAKRTGYDELFAFTSTLGGKAYFFARNDPRSATADVNIAAQNQLNGSRTNLDQYKYLQSLTSKALPWVGASFATKYGDNRDQILTQIFDYIRSTNLVDTSELKQGAGSAAFTAFYWSGTQDTTRPNPFSGQVIPIRIQQTQGFGRFVTVAEVAILFYRADPPPGPALPAGSVPLRAVMLFEMYTPSQGYPGLMENFSMRVGVPLEPRNPNRDLAPFRIESPSGGEIEMKFPVDAVNVVNVDSYSGPYGRMFMPFRGFGNQFLYFPKSFTAGSTWNSTVPKRLRADKAAAGSTLGAVDYQIYPFVSDLIILPPKGRNQAPDHFNFRGGRITVEIYAELEPSATSIPVQTLDLDFPRSNEYNKLPIPGGGSLDFGRRLTVGINGERNDGGKARSWIKADDVIRSIEVGGDARGDQRLVAGRIIVPPEFFAERGILLDPNPFFTNPGATNIVPRKHVHGLRIGRGPFYPDGDFNGNLNIRDGKLVADATYRDTSDPKSPRVQPGMQGVLMDNNKPGDWDRGISKNVDGAFIGKSDEGNVEFKDATPYFRGGGGYEELGRTYFSPNRLMPSAVVFGSLPTRVLGRLQSSTADPGPWETLLFRPPVSTSEHRGFQTIPDHYLLDLFHMPVVEPYAISEPFSTAGKINLNCEIAPFSYKKSLVGGAEVGYLERKTGLHALLRGVKLLAVPLKAPDGGHVESPIGVGATYRYDINRKLTISKIQERIDTQGLFKTGSEICEIDLYPQGLNVISMEAFHKSFPQSGDNARERPYAMIYPRVTTRSNVFTVYVRAQSLRKNPNGKEDEVDEFDPAKDQVTGEYRGSSIVERHLDPNDEALIKANYDPTALSGSGLNLNSYYRFRIVNTKRF